MKRAFIISFFFLAFAVSCTREIDPMGLGSQELLFHAVHGDGAETKSQLTESGAIVWTPNERINVFYGDVYSGVFTSTNTEPQSSVSFKGRLDGYSGGELGKQVFWAIYPYSESNTCEGNSVNLTLNSQQVAVERNFEDMFFPSIAKSDDFNLYFYNICGGIRFSVAREDVESVTIKGNNDELLAGTIQVTFGEEGRPVIQSITNGEKEVHLHAPEGKSFQPGEWYYAVLLPTTLEKGYSLTVKYKNGMYAEMHKEEAVSVKRSVWGQLSMIDAELPRIIPENELWYTTTDGKSLDISLGNMVSNTYSDGIGKFTFSRPLTSIPPHAFRGANSLKTMTLPQSVSIIGYAAFMNCENLTHIDLSNNLKSSGNSSFWGCKSLQEVSFPDSIEEIEYCAFLDCESISHVDFSRNLKKIGINAFRRCKNIQEIYLPEGLECIDGSAFGECTNLIRVEMPESLKSIGDFAFSSCFKLEELTIPANVESIGDAFVESCKNLKKVIMLPIVLPTAGGARLFEWVNKDCKIIIPAGTENAYTSARFWKYYVTMFHVEGHPGPLYYFSEDYSQDGEVYQLQKASVGKGINIILMGDGFVDRDMTEGGKYDRVMRQGMEAFFSPEPFKTFRNRFNVYVVRVVSTNDVFGIPEAKRKLSADLEGGGFATYYDVADEYASRVPNPDHQPNRICVMMNELSWFIDVADANGWCSSSEDGGWHGWTLRPMEGDLLGGTEGISNGVFIHENNGHGFGWLADEYIRLSGKEPSDWEKKTLDEQHLRGDNVNIDYRTDPNTVWWSRFLNDERYASEGLGIFEGAYWSYGMYRATEKSIMRESNDQLSFSAPSREQMYKKIMEFSEGDDWKYDFEEFVAADTEGRKRAAKAYRDEKTRSNSVKIPARNGVVNDNYHYGLPPIRVDGTIRGVRIGKDGEVTTF